jgi:endoglucanase
LSLSLPVDEHGWLGVAENGRLADQYGRAVALHGVSLFWSQWGGEFYTKDVVDWLRNDWGISVLRVPLGVDRGGILQAPDEQLRRIHKVISAAMKAGIYVIVDWHAHERYLDEACQFFEHIASEYGQCPNIIYETWNEPHGRFCWSADIKPYHNDVIATIRGISPRSLVIAGVENWSQRVDIAASDPLRFENVLYAVHFYAGSHGAALRRRIKRALRSRLPMIVSEWGMSEADGDGKLALRETRRWWRFMSHYGLSDVNWSIFNKNETSAALASEASPMGGWETKHLSSSGRIVRDRLRALAVSKRPNGALGVSRSLLFAKAQRWITGLHKSGSAAD